MKKDEWCLIESDDPTYVWTIMPTPDPTSGFTDAELDKKDAAFWAESNDWMNKATIFSAAMRGRPEDGWAIYDAGVKAGYTPDDGCFSYWLFDHLGKWLKANPVPTYKNRPFSDRLEVGDKEIAG